MRLEPRQLGLITSFAALYAVLSLVSLFPIIGAVGSFITLASIMAPLIGIVLGPSVGVVAVSIGGFLGWSITRASPFSFLSFVPGAITAFTSGFLYSGKRRQVFLLYLAVFLLLALYPTIGPVWLYPYYVWFQLFGLTVLASPLTPLAVAFTNKNNTVKRLAFGIVIFSLLSTLVGQMMGNLMYELMYYPIHPQIDYWRVGQWQVLTVIYPLERSIITALATVIGVPLIKAIRAYGFEMGGSWRNATLRITHTSHKSRE